MDNQEVVFNDYIKAIFDHIGEDSTREGLQKTPHRVYKSYQELFSGYAKSPQQVVSKALFNTTNNDMVIVKSINFFSMCEHHILPMFGKITLGYLPDSQVIGLSKIPKLIDVYAKRLQLQENLTKQIADAFMQYVKPKGVGIIVEARHMCIEMRGANKVDATTTTHNYQGVFTDTSIKEQFWQSALVSK